MKHLLLLMLASLPALKAEPTEVRQWPASSGHETEARALSATDTAVKIELASGKSVEFPLEKLVAEDREFVFKHFKVVPRKGADPQRSTSAMIQEEGQTWSRDKFPARWNPCPVSIIISIYQSP